jgi:diaminopimelate epimerase
MIKQGLNAIEMRTYERGVEGETLSCGTGATACALIHANQKDFEGNVVEVKTRGGDLKVSFDKSADGDFTNVFLIGPAKQIFNGQIEI